jgi:hypothetical protein
MVGSKVTYLAALQNNDTWFQGRLKSGSKAVENSHYCQYAISCFN